MGFSPDEVIVGNDGGYTSKVIDCIRSVGFHVTRCSWQLDIEQKADEWITKQLAQHRPSQILEQKNGVHDSLVTLYGYLHKNQASALSTFNGLNWYEPEQYMILDSSAQKNLELVSSANDHKQPTTLARVLDACVTPMGSRMVRKWVTRPLLDIRLIQVRQHIVEFFIKNFDRGEAARRSLQEIADLERVVGRIALDRATTHDIFALRAALAQLFVLTEVIIDVPGWPAELAHQRTLFIPLYNFLRAALVEEHAADTVIKQGFDAQFDEIRTLAFQAHTAIEALEKKNKKQLVLYRSKFVIIKCMGMQ